MKVIVVDFDGTIFDRGVVPRQDVIDFLKAKQDQFNLVLVTSRMPKQKQETLGLARRAGLIFFKSFFLGTGSDMVDKKVATVVKLNKGGNVEFAIDNNPDVRAAYNKAGIETVDPDNLTA